MASKGTCRQEVATSPDLHAGTVNLAGPSKTVSPSKSAAALEAVSAQTCGIALGPGLAQATVGVGCHIIKRWMHAQFQDCCMLTAVAD